MSDTDTPLLSPPCPTGEPHWAPALKRVGRLTPRERETFLLLAEGLSNESMAQRLHVTERTVRAHVAAVLDKLELNSRLAACLASYAFGTEVRSCGHPELLAESGS